MKSNKLTLTLAAILLAGASTGALADDKWTGDVGSNWLEHVQPAKSQGQTVAQASQAEQGSARSRDIHAQHRAAAATIAKPAHADSPTATSGRNTPLDNIYFSGA